MDWNILKNDFKYDGSLREILIYNTNTDDWKSILKYINTITKYSKKITLLDLTSEQEIVYQNNEIHNFIQKMNLEYFDKNKFNVLMEIFINNTQINSHFFSVEEIVFDINPKEIKNEADLKLILEFMENISKVTNKDSFLIYEGLYDPPILTYKSNCNTFIFDN